MSKRPPYFPRVVAFVLEHATYRGSDGALVEVRAVNFVDPPDHYA